MKKMRVVFRRLRSYAVLLGMCAIYLGLCATFFTGCGERGGETVGGSIEIYDAGKVSAPVPEGWMAIPVKDMWSDKGDVMDPSRLRICKGAKVEWDLFAHPYVEIIYYDSGTDMLMPPREFYRDIIELEPITAGDRTWEGFTGVADGQRLAILQTGERGADQLQVTVWLEANSGTISLEDADVQVILAGIQPVS